MEYKDVYDEYDDQLLSSMSDAYNVGMSYDELRELIIEQYYYLDKLIIDYKRKINDILQKLTVIRDKLLIMDNIPIIESKDGQHYRYGVVIYRAMFLATKVIEYVAHNATKMTFLDTPDEVYGLIELESNLLQLLLNNVV